MKKLLLSALVILFAAFGAATAQHMVGHHCSDSLRHSRTGVFLGARSGKSIDNNPAFSLGIHHELFVRSKIPYISFGMMGEIIFSENNQFLGAIPFFFHPVTSIKFWIAPGLIATNYQDGNNQNNDNSMMSSGHWDTSILVRIGGAYDLHFDEYSISPSVSIDIVNNEMFLVYGIVFGFVY